MNIQVGVWHCQVSPKLQINTSFTTFTSPAWHVHFLVGGSQPKPSLPNVAVQKSSRHKGPPQRWCYPNPGPPRTWRAARSALCCWKAWCHQEFARRSIAALKDRILQSSILLNFITPHIHTHIKGRRYMRGGCINKKTQKNSNQAIL